jgi:hypothetical protein
VTRTFAVKERYAGIAAAAAVLVKLAILFALAWNRRFVMDEFAQFGWAKYIPNQISYLAKHHPKAVGYAIFYDVAHLIGWDARSMLLIGRMQTALLACGTLAMVYAIARAMGESRLRAGVVLLVLLSFSNFIERVFETRAEPLATFFAVAALLVAVPGAGDLRSRRVIAAGVLSGLAFLSTQKSVYFDVALGLALVGDAAIGRRYGQAMGRGAWLVLGWLAPIVVYCLVFGGGDPVAVARNLFLGPVGVASPQTAAEYGGLRQYLVQTLVRNSLLYLVCFAGMALALLRIGRLEGARRIALIFSLVITTLVFAHNQPWPYVFVMALPFVALWVLWPLDVVAPRRGHLLALQCVLAVAIAASFVRNLQALSVDNHRQLELVGRAEALLGSGEVYFDGVGMLPDRPEPSTLWLDLHTIVQTLREGENSELYRIFLWTPPKLVIWSGRMDAVAPLVAPLLARSYVRISPNLWIAGRRLQPGTATHFQPPVTGQYSLYDETGQPFAGKLIVDGAPTSLPLRLPRGTRVVTSLDVASKNALLLPQGSYVGAVRPGADIDLFAGVYTY